MPLHANMSSDSPTKHYIPDTSIVDIDRAVFEKFKHVTGQTHSIWRTVVADTKDDIPEATEKLYEIIQQSDAVTELFMFSHHTYTESLDAFTGKVHVTLGLHYNRHPFCLDVFKRTIPYIDPSKDYKSTDVLQPAQGTKEQP